MKLKSSLIACSVLAGTIVALISTPAMAATRYEAEAAPAVCTGTISSNHAGYSGAGFCDADSAVGASARFTVTAPAAGTATLGVRFTNGTTVARTADVL